jgi:hypothetical protein
MDAGFIGSEIRDHRELAVEDRFAPGEAQSHDPLHARYADAVDREPDLRRFFLAIGEEVQRPRFLGDAARTQARGERADALARGRDSPFGSELGERHEIEGTLGEIRMRDGEGSEVLGEIVEEENIDIDRPRPQRLRALTADGEFDLA